MDESASQLVSELGSHLVQISRPNKDFLVKSLRQGASALSQIEQPSMFEAANSKQEALRSLEAAIRPLKKSIIKHGLLKHGDKDVRLLVAICVSEIFRILAPEPPFEDKYLRDVFKLFLRAFMELSDTASPYFSKRAKILEMVSRCKCFVIMLDIDCHDLVHEMFNIFFSVVRSNHQQSLINDISSIMVDIIKEETTSSLVDIILQNLVKEEKGATSAACDLAISLIRSCAYELEPFVCSFLTSCFVEKDAIQSDLKEFYHEIIFKIIQSAPQMLLAVIPNLTQELLTDQVDVRMKALNLAGKVFALPKHGVAKMYRDLFLEFLKRFSDKSAEVRMTALKCGKECYLANPSGTEASEILTAIQERLLDTDDRVRTQALIVACDLAKFNLKYIPPKLIVEASERLRDKKISVRKKALQKLIEVYQDYCNKCSEGFMTISEPFEQIPCKVLLLCFDKDCKEFRSQNMELVLSEDLFPRLLPVEKRMQHWVHLFSIFHPLHVKSLNSILSQKRRLQTEMRLCLAIWKEEKECISEEMQEKLRSSFVKMSASFPEPSKAQECFHQLNEKREDGIVDDLAQILDEPMLANAQTIRDKLLKMIGDKHPHYEFLRVLSSKCSCNIFSSEHVQYVLNQLSSNSLRNKHLKAPSIKLLVAILKMFPSYLRGSEELFLKLLEEEELNADELMEVLSKAASHMTVKFTKFYPLLERICLEGSRTQSKYAVSALASLIQSSDQFVFSELCEVLLDSLQSGRNIPTVLQSLGCVAQYSVSAFESIYGELKNYIYEKIFQAEPSDDLAPFDESSGCCNSCKLKIYGIKTLVKSFLPHCGHQVTHKIDELLKVLGKILKKADAPDNMMACESDGAHIRLAAAKAVLQLARKWDFHISPEIYCCTVLMAKDSDAYFKRAFLGKVHKLLKEGVIPSRYACAFSFGISDSLKDLQDESLRYMKDFINNTSREARIRHNQGGSVTDSPAYIVVFLIHVLAHDSGFPSEDCKDEHVYARFCFPLFSIISAVVGTSNVASDMDLAKNDILYLLYILRAIKRAEDAVEAHMTPKLHIVADIGISAVSMLDHTGVTQSRAPGQILLPSSLYRISLGKTLKNETNSRSLAWISLEKGFAEKVIHILQSQVSLPPSNISKHKRKAQENGTQVVRDNELPLLPCSLVENSTSAATKADQKNRKRKQAPSPSVGSLSMAQQGGTAIGRKNASSETSETILDKEQVSSCSSLVVRNSTELEVPNKLSTRKETFTKDNVGLSDRNDSEPSKYPCASSGGATILKDISNQSEAIVGQRIKLFSPFDGCFYSATVEGFNSESNAHKITCDNGDVELVCLDSESWETLSEESSVEWNTLGKVSETWGSENRSIDENVDTCRLKTLTELESRKVCSRRIPRSDAAKAKAGSKASNETSASEIINIREKMAGRRIRRQRVS